jgi:hypothetical protein
MSSLLLPFMVLAATGFVLSVAAHIFGLLGKMPPGGSLVMGLHAGIFVVWLPTVLVANRVARGINRKDFWKVVLAGSPPWMRYALYGLFAYAVCNFVLFILTAGGNNHASKAVTPETIRGFSGHWMVFYGAAFATLYSILRAPQLLRERQCVNGYAVSSTNAYCPTCGNALHKQPDG